MTLFFEDLRYTLRSFYKRPGFTATILVTLGPGYRKQRSDLQRCQRSALPSAAVLES